MNITIIGFMGSGKSHFAKKLAERSGKRLVSIDNEIEKREGMPIADIFFVKGEAYFRALEKQLLEDFLNEKDLIIDCGGGAAIYNAELIKTKSYVILVDTDFDVIWNRIKNDTSRPLLLNKTREEIRSLYDERVKIYRSICNEIIK